MDEAAAAIRLVGVGFQRGERWILRDINWTVAQGSCAVILGPNGSGKSTLARIIAGYLWPTAGEVSVLGKTFGEVNLHDLRRELKLVQAAAAPGELDAELTANEVLLTGFFGTLGLYDRTTPEMGRRASHIIDLVGLRAVGKHRFSTLSSGERVRCLIGRAMVVQPRLLILDEPTAGLDLLAREQVLATVQRLMQNGPRSPTVLIITHHVEELPPATSNVLLLSEGKIAGQGGLAKVLRAKLLERVYGCPLRVRRSNGRYYIHVNPGQWDGLIPPRSHERLKR